MSDLVIMTIFLGMAVLTVIIARAIITYNRCVFDRKKNFELYESEKHRIQHLFEICCILHELTTYMHYAQSEYEKRIILLFRDAIKDIASDLINRHISIDVVGDVIRRQNMLFNYQLTAIKKIHQQETNLSKGLEVLKEIAGDDDTSEVDARRKEAVENIQKVAAQDKDEQQD